MDEQYTTGLLRGHNEEISEGDESITELANRTMIIHPGSSHLRIGRAWDAKPQSIPHVIAWRHQSDNEDQSDNKEEKVNVKLMERDTEVDLQMMDDEMRRLVGHQQLMRWEEVQKLNVGETPRYLSEESGWIWTDTSLQPEYVVGEDALYIEETDCYNLSWPMVNGELNLANKSIRAVMTDLYHIWVKVIQQFFNISTEEIPKYRCILLVPDLYKRPHVKHLVNLLLDEMGFSSVIVHQESVCATYGCGLGTACVIDVGHQKTSICCVEDGLSLEDTRITYNLGGSDITRLFYHLLVRNSFPYKSCDPTSLMDVLLVEDLKETFCTLDFNQMKLGYQEFNLRRPDHKSLVFRIYLGNEIIQAPLSLFEPGAHGMTTKEIGMRFATLNSGDPEDPHDENYLAATRPKHTESMSCKKSSKFSLADPSELPNSPMSLEDAILWSVGRCPMMTDDELKRRMLNNLLLVGGGLAHFNGVCDVITRRLRMKIIGNEQFQSGGLEYQTRVVQTPKDLEPSMIAWKGGSVMSCLDTSQELWIDKREWKLHGLRMLRERSPFYW